MTSTSHLQSAGSWHQLIRSLAVVELVAGDNLLQQASFRTQLSRHGTLECDTELLSVSSHIDDLEEIKNIKKWYIEIIY